MGRLQGRLTPRRPRGRALGWAQAIPDLGLAAVFFVAPLGVLVAYSFGRQNSLTQDVSVTGTLRAYRLLFSDLYRPVFLRSFWLAMASLALCLLIGIPSALTIVRAEPRWQRLLLIAVLFPSFVSFTVRIYAWVGLLGNQGTVAGVTERLTGTRVVLLFRPGGLLVGMVTAYVPLFLLPVVVSMQRIPRSLLDASGDLGAATFTTTRRVVLPLAMPGIITGSVLVVILSLGEFLIPTVLGGGKVLLLGTLLAEQAGGRNKPLGGAIATTLVLAMLIVSALGSLAIRRVSRHA